MTEAISVQVIGDREFASYLDRLGTKINPAMKQTMAQATILVQDQAKTKYLNLSKPGPSGLHVVTGRLRSSIDHKVKGEGIDIIGQVGTNVPYGRIWETRSKDSRPFLTPALRDKKTDVFKMFDEAISKLIGAANV